MFRKFHPEHFVCAFCLKQLNKGTFKEQNDKPYCHVCFDKLFGWIRWLQNYRAPNQRHTNTTPHTNKQSIKGDIILLMKLIKRNAFLGRKVIIKNDYFIEILRANVIIYSSNKSNIWKSTSRLWFFFSSNVNKWISWSQGLFERYSQRIYLTLKIANSIWQITIRMHYITCIFFGCLCKLIIQ